MPARAPNAANDASAPSLGRLEGPVVLTCLRPERFASWIRFTSGSIRTICSWRSPRSMTVHCHRRCIGSCAAPAGEPALGPPAAERLHRATHLIPREARAFRKARCVSRAMTHSESIARARVLDSDVDGPPSRAPARSCRSVWTCHRSAVVSRWLYGTSSLPIRRDGSECLRHLRLSGRNGCAGPWDPEHRNNSDFSDAQRACSADGPRRPHLPSSEAFAVTPRIPSLRTAA